jgi:hypothetical protein
MCGVSEYRITSDPAGASEMTSFSTGAMKWGMSAVTIKPM